MVATTASGTTPAERSDAMARASASGSIRSSASVPIFVSDCCPSPMAMTALSTDECAWLEQYTRNAGRSRPDRPRVRTPGTPASRAAASACIVEIEAVS